MNDHEEIPPQPKSEVNFAPKIGRLAAALVSLIVTSVALVLVFIWPTQWRYFEVRLDSVVVPIRSNRFTDQTQRLTLGGWIDQESSETSLSGAGAGPVAELAPALELTPSPTPQKDEGFSKIELQEQKIEYNRLSFVIYNGSEVSLTTLQFEVILAEGGKRLYDVEVTIAPRTIGDGHVYVGLYPGQVTNVRLAAVNGRDL